MLEPVLNNPWVRAVGVLLALLLAGAAVYLLMPVITALLFSFIIAYLLAPVVTRLERRGISRMAAIAALLLAVLIAATALPVYLVVNIIQEGGRLAAQAQTGLQDQYLDRIMDSMPLHEMVSQLGWAPEGETDFDERAVILEHIGVLVRDHALAFLQGYGLRIADFGRQAGLSAAQLLGTLGMGAMRVAAFLVNISLFLMVAAYLLRDYDAVIAGARELTPPRYRLHLDRFMHKVDMEMRSLLRGQITVCAGLAVMYAVGLHLAGVPFAFPIALIGGAASIIPYVGPTITLVPSLLLTLLYYGVSGNLVGVLVVFVFVQGIESYILTPRVIGSQLGLNPVWVIVGLMVFSTVLGFKGVVLAMPLTALLKVVVLEGVAAYRQSYFFSGTSSGQSS